MEPVTFRILIVEDDERVAHLMERVLRSKGYETTEARTGREAMECIRRSPPFDLLIVDLVMPDTNGETLVRTLREFDNDLRVLYCTGHAERLRGRDAVGSRNEAVLEKPASIHDLLKAVATLLGQAPPAPSAHV